jgi:hypothetical protein
MKHRIMEAILSAENNLSQEEIVWAMHNIPNDNTASTPSRKFDHEKDSVFEACGFTNENSESLKAELNKLNEITEGSRKSQFIETVLTRGSEDLRSYLVVRGLMDLIKDNDKDDPLDRLRDLLRKIK